MRSTSRLYLCMVVQLLVLIVGSQLVYSFACFLAVMHFLKLPFSEFAGGAWNAFGRSHRDVESRSQFGDRARNRLFGGTR